MFTVGILTIYDLRLFWAKLKFALRKSKPDFSFYTSGMSGYGRLEIEVTQAACDTILLVNSANASWFYDDDSAGYPNPRINLYGTANTQGRIDVWVGTYGTSNCSATLEMETWYN